MENETATVLSPWKKIGAGMLSVGITTAATPVLRNTGNPPHSSTSRLPMLTSDLWDGYDATQDHACCAVGTGTFDRDKASTGWPSKTYYTVPFQSCWQAYDDNNDALPQYCWTEAFREWRHEGSDKSSWDEYNRQFPGRYGQNLWRFTQCGPEGSWKAVAPGKKPFKCGGPCEWMLNQCPDTCCEVQKGTYLKNFDRHNCWEAIDDSEAHCWTSSNGIKCGPEGSFKEVYDKEDGQCGDPCDQFLDNACEN